MSFKDQLADDFVSTFLNSDEFAENVTYTPKSGTAKTIKAIVERKRTQPAGEDTGRLLSGQIEIVIANDSTSGVTSVKKGADAVSVAERVGGSSVAYTVVDIIGQDEGMWHLLLQK